jgi:peptide/nickel transport system substrate-binding protein
MSLSISPRLARVQLATCWATRLFVLSAALCLSGCARDPVAADPSKLNVAMSTFSEGTFLPWNGSTGRKFYLDTVYEYLAYLDPESGEPTPGLAERWEMSPDGKTWTFWLRRGVAFHDGWGDVTADDVKYTLDRIRDPKSIAGPASPLRQLIASVDAPEPQRVVITLASPDIDFIRAYLSNGLIVPVVSKKYLEEKGDAYANEHPIGTGVYRMVEYRKGVSMTMRADKSQAHWRVTPQFDEIRFLAVPEEFTRAAMLKTGEVDLAPINYDSIRAIEQAGLQLLYVQGNWAPVVRLGGLSARFSDPTVPWSDKRVRQALNYAIDKQAIVKAIFHGHARIVGADFPAPEWMNIPPYPYDPEKARALLKEAGYPNGFPIKLKTFTTNPGAELPIVAEAVSLYWQAIGVEAAIEPTNWTSLRSAWTSGNANDIVWTHRGLAFSGTLAGLQASVMSTSLFATYSNAITDQFVLDIGSALIPAERAERIRETGEYLREEAAAVYIAFADEPYGASKKVGHWPALSQQGTNIDLITRAAE